MTDPRVTEGAVLALVRLRDLFIPDNEFRVEFDAALDALLAVIRKKDEALTTAEAKLEQATRELHACLWDEEAWEGDELVVCMERAYRALTGHVDPIPGFSVGRG